MPSPLGTPTRLLDGRAKVTGDIRYAPDVNMAGLLHARFVTSLYAHANLRAIDKAPALAVPGVAAVLTAADLPDLPPSSRSKLLLARGRVMFVGQPIALVLAETEAAAEDGVALVMVDYEPLPAVLTIETALADDAPLVWPTGVPDGSSDAAGAHGADVGGEKKEKSKPSNIAGQGSYTRGDVKAGFAEADVIVERTFYTPMVHQSPIETQSVVAQYDAVTGGATLWASTQSQFGVREEVAKLLAVPESDVRVIATPVGGAFGSKFGLYEPLAALAARAVKRPVKLALTRSEEMLAANPAPPIRLRARLGAKRDGTLTALEGDVLVDNGCYPFDISGFFAYMLASFYRVPNFDVKGLDVLTFKQSAGAYRAPGAPTITLALDCLMDELAQKLNLDPIEFRLHNAARAGDPMADEDAWPTIGMRDVLTALSQHPAWQNREQARAQGRGVGISVGGWPGGTEPAAAACALHRDGTLHIHVGSVDISGTLTGFALLAAEAFGIAPEQVRLHFDDTDTAPYSGGSGGSKVTFTTGTAVVNAAREARQQTLVIAAAELEASVEDLEIVDGEVRVRGVPGKGLSLKKIASKTMRFGGKHAPVFAQGRTNINQSAPGFSAQLAEVEVDKETGAVRLHRMVMAQDVGKAINPLTVQGQMMGGAVQGVGWALYESMAYDEQGQLLTSTLMDYALPHIQHTAPVMETVLVEIPSDNGPFGARGVGEPPVVPTAAAIANAIADATGLRLTDLPMTAPKVLAALSKM